VRLLKTFVAAMETHDEQALMQLFAPDATWTADGGGKTAAGPRPFEGADAILKLLLGLQRRFSREGVTLHLGTVNGETGLLVRHEGRVAAAISMAIEGDRIAHAYAIVNPDKLPATM
jgi:RNA polymerase sigma-70 factor (ECF subfamily)